MNIDTKTSSHRRVSDRTRLEKIAADTQRPMEVVEQLYLSALTVLDREARIQAFVPVIAERRVKEALRNDAGESRRERA
jgi:hypothetical protein